MIVIAIDGPSAAGKGTLAKMIAGHLGFAHLDSGSLYRAVALSLFRAGLSPGNKVAARAVAASLDADILADPALRDQATGEAASIVAEYPEVREALLAFQRRFAANPPGGAEGAVIDGRDIGTVVCPEADFKLFVTASDEERARRRTEELQGRGEQADPEEILAEIRRRDSRDRERAVAPLRKAEDALLLDTTKLDIEAAFEVALDMFKGHLAADQPD